MLVLARLRDETIMIGDEVQVTIVDIRGDKVRLGISAPKSIPVHRKEIYDAIRNANRDAAGLQPGDLYPNILPGPAPAAVKLAPPPSPIPFFDRSAHEPFLCAAVDEARKGLSEGGVPIGAVLVRGGEIIGRGHNRRVQRSDPMAHAEIDALSNAGRQKSYRDTVLYSTLMPCYLCSGAAVQFGIPRVVVGDTANCGGAPDLLRARGVEVIDLHDADCIKMMAEFIRVYPGLWHEDIGK